jgi:hypothetical protein
MVRKSLKGKGIAPEGMLEVGRQECWEEPAPPGICKNVKRKRLQKGAFVSE